MQKLSLILLFFCLKTSDSKKHVNLRLMASMAQFRCHGTPTHLAGLEIEVALRSLTFGSLRPKTPQTPAYRRALTKASNGQDRTVDDS